MVQITSILLATAAVLGAGVSAQQRHPTPFTSTACTQDEFYCGFELLNSPFQEYWRIRIDDALRAANKVPINGTLEFDSLFSCRVGTAGSAVLQLDQWCPELGGNWRCHPPSHDQCKTRGANGLVEINSCCDNH